MSRTYAIYVTTIAVLAGSYWGSRFPWWGCLAAVPFGLWWLGRVLYEAGRKSAAAVPDEDE